MLGDAEAVVDRGIAGRRVETGGGADVLRRNAENVANVFRRIRRSPGEVEPVPERLGVAALFDEAVVDQVLRGHDVGEGVHQRDVGPGL